MVQVLIFSMNYPSVGMTFSIKLDHFLVWHEQLLTAITTFDLGMYIDAFVSIYAPILFGYDGINLDFEI